MRARRKSSFFLVRHIVYVKGVFSPMFDFLAAAQDFFGSVADTISHVAGGFFNSGHTGGGGGKTNPANIQIPGA